MKIPKDEQTVTERRPRPTKNPTPHNLNIKIALPIADELRAVAEKLGMPYETVRAIVVARISPEVQTQYVGRVAQIVRGEIVERLTGRASGVDAPVEMVEAAG